MKEELENIYSEIVNGLYINSRFNFIDLTVIIIFVEYFLIFKEIFICIITYVK